MTKRNLKSCSLSGLTDIVQELGLEQYRAAQLFQWLWQKNAREFSQMTNLSKGTRDLLDEKFYIACIGTVEQQRANDNTRKFVLELADSNAVEAVFIPEGRRRTLCISTQVGCALGCKFCATGLLGLKRNMEAWEIASEVQLLLTAGGERITNIVCMGMGEPFLNTEQVFAAIEIISSPTGLAVSQRHTTISTAGVIDGMRQLIASTLKVKLAVSLNFADEALRREMMPVSRKNPLKEVLKLAREYSEKKHMVTFEYVMIGGVNDSLKDASRLLELLRNIPSKINLIPYNEHPGLSFEKPDPKKFTAFHEELLRSRHTVTVRKSKGQDILAGCGQLAGSGSTTKKDT
jgi:23S rRNA (adenine2503-C2)-methyltransferase